MQLLHALCDRRSAAGLDGYLRSVVIDSRPDPRRFADVARPWQWDRVRRLKPALEALAGLTPPLPPGAPRCHWETMPRGHDKTTGLARFINWLLAYSRRPLEIVSASGDWDQAALLNEAMRRELELNPWLAPRLKVRSRHSHGPGGHMKVLTADAPTSMGKRTDLFVIDELTWWKKRDLWDTLWSGWQKMPGAVMAVITNAGVQGSWQHEVWQQVQQRAAWCVYDAPGQLETWMSEADIAEVRALLPRGFARRVLDNVWIDPAEDGGYLTRAEVEACEELGRQLGLGYCVKGRPEVEYVLSVDYGPKRDRTCLAVLHQEPDGMVVVDQLDVWQGSPEEPVQIGRIREWIDERRKAFNAGVIVLDPYQLEELAQDYEHHLEVIRYEARGGKANYAMAACMRTLVVNRRIAWPAGCGGLPVNGKLETLLDEVPRLVIKLTPYGYRFDHEAKFHDDRWVCLGMGAVTLLGRERATTFKAGPALQLKKPDLFRVRTAHRRELYGLVTGNE